MSLQQTKRETNTTRQAEPFPGFCEEHPDFKEPGCEACELEWNWNVEHSVPNAKYKCAFIWDWASSNPRICYQCGESEASHLDR